MKTRTATEAKDGEQSYCRARTRKQVESPYWGDSKIGCGRFGLLYVTDSRGSGWVCTQHAGVPYGWNDE